MVVTVIWVMTMVRKWLKYCCRNKLRLFVLLQYIHDKVCLNSVDNSNEKPCMRAKTFINELSVWKPSMWEFCAAETDLRHRKRALGLPHMKGLSGQIISLSECTLPFRRLIATSTWVNQPWQCEPKFDQHDFPLPSPTTSWTLCYSYGRLSYIFTIPSHCKNNLKPVTSTSLNWAPMFKSAVQPPPWQWRFQMVLTPTNVHTHFGNWPLSKLAALSSKREDVKGVPSYLPFSSLSFFTLPNQLSVFILSSLNVFCNPRTMHPVWMCGYNDKSCKYKELCDEK